jgi:hypothetical protein
MSYVRKNSYLSQIYITFSTYLSIAHLDASDSSKDDLLGRISSSPKTVRILSLDGGGVRGVAEARFLQHLEKKLGRSTSDTFHLIGGTSAGGVLATFLTVPEAPGSTKAKYSAKNLVDILMKRSADMFVPLYISLGGLFGPKYKTERFRSVASEYLLDEETNNTTIPTMVIAYDMQIQDFKAITSWDEEEIFKKVDAVNSTAAAASYFQPCRISPVNDPEKSYILTDGGVGANNPTLFLLTKAMELYPDADHFEVLSVGSGYANRPLFYEDMKDAGLIQWIPHLTRIFINGQTTKDHKFLTRMFSSESDLQDIKQPLFRGKYSRWSPLLSRENTKLDNTDNINLMTIVSATDHYVELRQREFEELVDRLRNPKDEL